MLKDSLEDELCVSQKNKAIRNTNHIFQV